MKRFLKATLLAVVGLSLASFTSRTCASVLTDSYTNGFDLGGNTTDFSATGSVHSWIYWYGLGYNNTQMTNDVTMDAANATNTSGSLEVFLPFGSAGDQGVFFGTFNNGGAYDESETADGTKFTNITFDIHIDPAMQTNSAGNFGVIQTGLNDVNTPTGGRFYGGGITIPANATNGWVHMSQPIDYTTPDIGNVMGVNFKYTSFSGYPKFPFHFWIDNVEVHLNPGPPPPNPTLASGLEPAKNGLNSIGVLNSTFNRYHIATVADTGYTFINQPSVTYKWTISQFPTNTDWQQHIFFVNGAPGQFDQAADFNLADCIFLTVQSAGPGKPATFNFRYKTNEPAGNGMLFNFQDPKNGITYPVAGSPTMPAAAVVDPNGPLGTWSITFAGNTNVTMTSPSGVTTNFVFDPASAALFNDPMTLCVGGQANSDGFGQILVLSNFTVTGSASPLSDNFATDTSLDTNTWKNLANDTNGVVLVPPGSAFWVKWSIPDAGFSPRTIGNLPTSTNNPWLSLNNVITIQDNGDRQILVPSNDLPNLSHSFFSLIKHTFSQLQVLLPGETAAPGTPTGKTGTPTAVNQGDNVTITVNAVDSQFNLIPGVADTVSFSSTDGAAALPNPGALANGTGQFTIEFFTSGTNTVTATDTTTVTIPPATSAGIIVN